MFTLKIFLQVTEVLVKIQGLWVFSGNNEVVDAWRNLYSVVKPTWIAFIGLRGRFIP